MATTRLISMQQNKEKSIAFYLSDRTEYAKNPDKTKDGELKIAIEKYIKYYNEQRIKEKLFRLSNKNKKSLHLRSLRHRLFQLYKILYSLF